MRSTPEAVLADYRRPASLPPGPRWKGLLGRPSPPIALVSLYVIENTGIRLLAALLRREGYRVHEIYFKDWVTNRVAAPRPDEVAALLGELRATGSGLVGLSVRASAFHRIARSLTERIRAELGVPVLWGGMHATSCPEDAIRVADLVAVGEAERSLPDLLRALRDGAGPGAVAGIWSHADDGIVRNPVAPLVDDLDALPFPDFASPDKVQIDGERRVVGDPCLREPQYLLSASRGCPFPSCGFCSNSVLDRVYEGQTLHRLRSVEHVLAEAREAVRVFPRLRRVRFDDEEFPLQPAWLDAFCRRWPVEIGLPFDVHMDPRAVTAERLDRLIAAGMECVFMGIQSTERVNRALYDRDVSDAQVLRAAGRIHASGARAGYQVILDDRFSGPEDKRRLLDLLLALPRPYELVLFSLALYPGSRVSEALRGAGVIGEHEIEGPATKVFRQFRVDLSWPRPDEDRFWTALVVLASKDFVPAALVRALSRSRRLKRAPAALHALAWTANAVKLTGLAAGLAARGEISPAVLRRWAGLRTLVTY